MTRIIIRMNNEGGELDRCELHVEDAEDESCAMRVATRLAEMVLDCGMIHPGDSFTVEKG